MSTKFIGIGALAAGCLTAAVAGYVVLRDSEPAPVQVAALVETPVTMPEAVPVAQPGEPVAVSRPVPAAPAPRSAPATRPAPVRTAPTPEPVATPDLMSVPAPAPAPPVTVPPPVVTPPAAPPEPQRYVPDPAPVPQPAAAVDMTPHFDEVIVERQSVIGIRLDHAISTRTARVEDRVLATVSRDVTVQGRVAIPSGATLEGTVTAVDRGGKFRERPRLGLRFDTMILTDGTRLSIRTDTIYREGDSPSADATAKVGGAAVAGAIIGAVLGGKKGAAIGGAAGAAGGAATVMAGDGDEVALRAGAPLTVRLTEDLAVLVKRH